MRQISLIVLLFLVACSPLTATPTSPTPTSSPAPTTTPSPTASATLPESTGGSETRPDETPAPATPENSKRPHYELWLTLDAAAHLASVDERIAYTNQTGETLNELVLAVEPRLWPGTFLLTDLQVNGEASNADFSGQRMTVKLAAPLGAGQSVSLEIEYKLQIPPANRRYLFGYNARQTNLLDWYPFIAPYKNSWILHDPAPVGEHLVYESADFDVYLKFANTTNPPTVAASAPGIPEGEWTHYRLQGARGFSLSASDHFLSSTANAGGVPVTSYYFDGHQAAGAQAAEMAAQAIRLFSEKFAPYPYQSLSIVESASDDGMEADGLFFMAGQFYESYNGTLENYLTMLSVHETAHQWWYGLVGNDQALEPWLDEALATYAERVFYAENYPDSLNGWWYFRIRRFDPVGAMNESIYANGSFRTYTNATYFVGTYFLEDLRARFGDDILAAALSDYTQKNAGRIATAQDFFAVLNQHTSVDYSDIVERYFKGQ